MQREINFDGIIGPTHNYAGLSHGNLASARNAQAVSHPKAAALQGLAKMQANRALGLEQAYLLPHNRPNPVWTQAMALDLASAPSHLRATAWSASAMWTANAATVSPAADTLDGRCHLTVANLATMPHRAHEWPETLRQLQLAFADDRHFAVHPPVPVPYGDEGAANHMRMAARHDAPAIEIFVYGRAGGIFPARQHREASEAVARLNGVKNAIFAEQAEAAIAAGAFHNDVVAVANEHVLFAHELAFADPEGLFNAIRHSLPEAEIIIVPAADVSLAEAISSYLFNAQLVTLPEGQSQDAQEMALIVPTECMTSPAVSRYLEGLVRANGPIRRVIPVDVRQSMANGGGPACLRLRVVADPATVDQRFMLDDAKAALIAGVIEAYWPDAMTADDLLDPATATGCIAARAALLEALGLAELI